MWELIVAFKMVSIGRSPKRAEGRCSLALASERHYWRSERLAEESPGRRGSDCRPGLGAAGAPEPGPKSNAVHVSRSIHPVVLTHTPSGDGCEVQNGELNRRGAALRRRRAGERCRSERWFPCASVLVRAVMRALTCKMFAEGPAARSKAQGE